MESLRCGWLNKLKNDEVGRFSLRQAEADLESPLLAIWRLKCEHLLAIRPSLSELIRTKPNVLDSMVLFEFGKVNRWKIVRFPLTPLFFKNPLKTSNLIALIGTDDVLQFP